MKNKLLILFAGAFMISACGASVSSTSGGATAAPTGKTYGTKNYQCSDSTDVSMTYLDRKKEKAFLSIKKLATADDKSANMLNFNVNFHADPPKTVYINKEGVKWIQDPTGEVSLTFPLGKKDMMVICKPQ